MPKDTAPRSRRAAVATIAAAAAAVAVTAAAAHPDADLIAACEAFTETERRLQAIYPGCAAEILDEATRALIEDDLWGRQRALVRRICAARATTLDGIRARAAAIAAFDPMWLEHGALNWDERMLAALLRDLTAGPPARA